MGKFLKAAFFLRYPISGLGRVPLNLLALVGATILGFAHPGFWLLGAAAEAGYLAVMSSSPRFRRYVTGMDLAALSSAAQQKRKALIGQLDGDAQARLGELEGRSAKVIALYEGQGADQFVLDSSREALQRLQWMYLKLLLARNYLASSESVSTQDKLTRDVQKLERELQSEKLTPGLRESKTGTLDILRRRLENLERREQSLQEIDSDLQRVEAQVELAIDEAAMKGKPQAVSSSIELVSHLLDLNNSTPAFNEADAPTIQELEDAYQAPAAEAKALKQ